MRIATVLAIILFCVNGLYSQISQEQVMIKAKLVDENTGEPLGAEIEFKLESGKKFVKKSDKTTGKFDVLIPENTTYEVEVSGNDVYREVFSYTSPSTGEESYKEFEHTFKVKKLAPGVVVSKQKIFAENSSELTQAGKNSLDAFKTNMRFNRNAEFNFQVNAQSKSVAEKRLASLKEYLSDWRRYLRMIEFSTGTGSDDLIIKISKVKDIFK